MSTTRRAAIICCIAACAIAVEMIVGMGIGMAVVRCADVAGYWTPVLAVTACGCFCALAAATTVKAALALTCRWRHK